MSDGSDVTSNSPALVVVDVQRFKEAVWAVERENFRPGNALDALERAIVSDASDITALPEDR